MLKLSKTSLGWSVQVQEKVMIISFGHPIETKDQCHPQIFKPSFIVSRRSVKECWHVMNLNLLYCTNYLTKLLHRGVLVPLRYIHGKQLENL